MDKAKVLQSISDRSFMAGLAISSLFVADAFTVQLLTGPKLGIFPLWVTVCLGVGLLLTVLGAWIMKYAIEGNKLERSDTVLNLVLRVSNEIVKLLIFFSLFAGELTARVGVAFATCGDPAWAAVLQVLTDRLVKMMSLDILEIAGLSLSSCTLNQGSGLAVLLTVVFHLAASFILLPYLVAMIRHLFRSRIRAPARSQTY